MTFLLLFGHFWTKSVNNVNHSQPTGQVYGSQGPLCASSLQQWWTGSCLRLVVTTLMNG